MKEKLLRVIGMTVTITAITQLALSQLSIRIARLSAEELTGISYFAFIILGMVTLFASTRMGESFFGRFFAVIMNFTAACMGLWYLSMLFSDEIFFRNLYYNLDRQTQTLELLPLGGRITASIPLALVVLGTAVYLLCGIAIITVSFASIRKKQIEKTA